MGDHPGDDGRRWEIMMMQVDDAPGNMHVGSHPLASFALWGMQYSQVGNNVSTYFDMLIIQTALIIHHHPILTTATCHYVWIYYDIL